MPVSSLPFSLSDVASEFGVSAPYSLADFYRGGSNVGQNVANSSVPESGSISLSDFAGASGADFEPSSLNWGSIAGSTSGENSNDTVSGITQSIDLNIISSGLGFVLVSVNDGAFQSSSSVSVSNGDDVKFRVTSGGAASGTVTIRTGSHISTPTLDTFSYTLTG